MSRNSTPPITSLQTYQLIGADKKKTDWKKIILALTILDVPSTGRKIAEKAGIDYHAVMRRVGELESQSIIYKAGKTISDNGYPCALYALVHQPSLSQVQTPENIEHSGYIQQNLF